MNWCQLVDKLQRQLLNTKHITPLVTSINLLDESGRKEQLKAPQRRTQELVSVVTYIGAKVVARIQQ